jgi:Phosphate transport (Pho88)
MTVSLLVTTTLLLIVGQQSTWVAADTFSTTRPTGRALSWGLSVSRRGGLWRTRYPKGSSNTVTSIITSIPRGGSSKQDEQEDDDDELEKDTSQNDDELEDEDEEDSLQEEEDSASEEELRGVKIELAVEKYDEPWTLSPYTNLYVSLGFMMLAKRIDLLHPVLIRLARLAFICYLILQQVFLWYVRIQAKLRNDTTPLQVSNPLLNLFQAQIGDGGGSSTLKDLASSFLRSSSTVVEYDLTQAKQMQSGLIFNMLIMWFLHFKMEQVQPLWIQTVNGLLTLVYSPLFQIYILGRNLERPFATPQAPTLSSEQSPAETVAEDESTAQDDNQESDDGDEIVDGAVDASAAANSQDEGVEDESIDGQEEEEDNDDE